MTSISPITMIKIKPQGHFLARKYEISCSLREQDGRSYRHSSGIVIPRIRTISASTDKLLHALSQYPKAIQLSNIITFLVHRKTINILRGFRTANVDIERLRDVFAGKESVVLLEVDGFALLLPADFLSTEIADKSPQSGVISAEVIHQGELKIVGIRYQRKKIAGLL